MIFLNPKEPFPPVENADSEGLLAFSMNLSLKRLLEAYQKGIFPWYNAGEPVMWWSPDPRMVLYPKDLNVSKSMRKVIKSNIFKITYNQSFEDVLHNCRKVKRINQDGTWITDEIVEYYKKLHHLGMAHSVEVWNKNDELVGGLYGIWLNKVFFGESMFAKESNASKAGFISFVSTHMNKIDIIDCQIYTEHLASLGARLIPRKEFLKYLT